MSDTAAIILESSTWRVGKWTCRLQVQEQGPDAVAITVWKPDHPDRLDSAEVVQLQAGRAAARAQVEKALGREVTVR